MFEPARNTDADPAIDTYARLSQQITERGPWQQTATGNAFFLGDPSAGEVDPIAVASSLGRLCRYNGHLKFDVYHYSVAQHATNIARWMREDGHDTDACFYGLHHDSAEAYTGDIISQVKQLVPEFRLLEDAVERAVLWRMGIGPAYAVEMKPLIKRYDFLALATEVRDLLPPNQTRYTWGDLPEPRKEHIIPVDSRQATVDFLAMHRELGGAYV